MKNSNYRIGVITNATGQSMQDMQKMSAQHGIVFDQIKHSSIPLKGFRDSDLVKKICSYDIVYYRTGLKGAVLEELSSLLKESKIPQINTNLKHPSLHQKNKQALIADRYNIAQPKSFIIKNFNYEKASKHLGSTFVIKPSDGSKGNGVALIKSAQDLDNYKSTATKSEYIYQEFIDGADEYRVYTLGGQGVVSYKKIAGSEDFRANLHTGGSMEVTEPKRDDQLLKFGGHIAECFGADISGVDILYKDGKCLFIELNWQPGWEHLDELTGSHFCRDTLQYILNKAHNESTASKKLWRLFS